MENVKILVAEDDKHLREGIMEFLQDNDYIVYGASCEAEAMDLFEKMKPQLVLLDINLGEDSGYDVCKKIRKVSDIPILFLTSYNDEGSLFRGYHLGCDDYITKPFRIQEVLVRIQAIIRRCYSDKISSNIQSEIQKVHSGGLVVDYAEQKVWKEESLILTPIEYKLITCLLKNYPNVVERDTLLYKIWDKDEDFIDNNTLNVHMSRLREKLGEYQDVEYIRTVRGSGYAWNVDVEKAD